MTVAASTHACSFVTYTSVVNYLCDLAVVVFIVTSVTQLTKTSFKTIIYTIMNRITTNITSHKC